VLPFAAVWRKASTTFTGVPVEVHVAGSDEQADAMLNRYLELLGVSTHPLSEPLFRLACAADAYLNELNNTISRHGSNKLERRLPRLAFAIGARIERSKGANFEVEATALPHNAVVVISQHGHTVCMTSVRGLLGDAIAVTGSRASTCVVAGQRLAEHPGDLTDLSRYFGVSGVVIERCPTPTMIG
jgi:hypothetical protein